MAPTWGKCMHLAVKDVNRAINAYDIYGALMVDDRPDRIIMVKNYPVNKVHIGGKLLSANWRSERGFFMLRVDDTSGKKLVIDVKISELAYFDAGGKIEPDFGCVVSLRGYASIPRRGVLFIAATMELHSSGPDLMADVSPWRLTLRDRLVLHPQWMYSPKDNWEKIADKITEEVYSKDLDEPYIEEVDKEAILDIIAKERDVERERKVCVEKDREAEIYLEYLPGKYEISDNKEESSSTEKSSGIEEQNTTWTKTIQYQAIVNQMIIWMLSHQQPNFRLSQLYRDEAITILLSQAKQKAPKVARTDIFHTARHHIQTTGLITINTTQTVDCSRLLHSFANIRGALQTARLNHTPFQIQKHHPPFLEVMIDYEGGWEPISGGWAPSEDIQLVEMTRFGDQ